MEIRESKIVLAFVHIYGGLVAEDGKVAGFAVSGNDRVFRTADARIENGRVTI